MMKKIIILSALVMSLLSSVHSIASSSVDATIQFKNEDSKESAPVVSTMQPYLDNFRWVRPLSGYKAIWNFPTQVKSFKDVDKLTLAPQESVSANLSYSWYDNWYGMSQYAFNYADRPKEYGCFVTELRLSGRKWETHNYNIVIASYRKDPTHPDDYLTCYAEKNAASSFTIHMASSKNKKEEKSFVDDSQRYSEVGDVELLKSLDYYHIDRSIELWKDQNNNLAFVLANNKETPAITSIQSSNFVPPYIFTIKLINNTTQTVVAGQPLFDKWSRVNIKNYIIQPVNIQPASIDNIKLRGSTYSYARLNYHFAGSTDDRGCYIGAFTNNDYTRDINYNELVAFYRFDRTHSFRKKFVLLNYS